MVSAPEGAFDFRTVSVSLKRYPDTEPDAAGNAAAGGIAAVAGIATAADTAGTATAPDAGDVVVDTPGVAAAGFIGVSMPMNHCSVARKITGWWQRQQWG